MHLISVLSQESPDIHQAVKDECRGDTLRAIFERQYGGSNLPHARLQYALAQEGMRRLGVDR